jgi:hypothetical protein
VTSSHKQRSSKPFADPGGAAFAAAVATRLPWRDYTTVIGDQQTAATFLDTLNLI